MSDGADQYAVFGHPVGHSKSSQIHRAFAQSSGQHLNYRAIEAPLDGFGEAIASFRQVGGRGCNVTLPFKGEACQLAEQLDDYAAIAGAVNTLHWNESGTLRGFNTDGRGLLRDLQQNLNIELTGRKILLVGAGGAAAGVVGPLLEALPEKLVVVNRTAQRAIELVERFAGSAADRISAGIMAHPGSRFDLVINATSAGLAGGVPDLPDGLFAVDGWAYDLVYADQPTEFMRWSMAHGAAHASDGLGMLVEQAAESFFIWRGIRPATQQVITDLRNAANYSSSP